MTLIRGNNAHAPNRRSFTSLTLEAGFVFDRGQIVQFQHGHLFKLRFAYFNYNSQLFFVGVFLFISKGRILQWSLRVNCIGDVINEFIEILI